MLLNCVKLDVKTDSSYQKIYNTSKIFLSQGLCLLIFNQIQFQLFNSS